MVTDHQSWELAAAKLAIAAVGKDRVYFPAVHPIYPVANSWTAGPERCPGQEVMMARTSRDVFPSRRRLAALAGLLFLLAPAPALAAKAEPSAFYYVNSNSLQICLHMNS